MTRKQEHIATVKLRKVSQSVRGDGKVDTFGITIPVGAIIRLGWRLGDLLDVWVDEGSDKIQIQRVRVSPSSYA